MRQSLLTVNGSAVRVIREALGVKRANLAKAAGISEPFLCRIELGTRQPGTEVRHRIAVALGVPVAAIIRQEIAPPATQNKAA
jgi:transcriptional regulator with XRE-family HTH domain